MASMVYNDFDMPLITKFEKLEKIALASADGEFKRAITDSISKNRELILKQVKSKSWRR